MNNSSFEICNVCTKSMVEPKILPCAHSFCLKCLESSIDSQGVTVCPTCLVSHRIPEGGLKSLKRNEFVELLAKCKLSKINCDSCGEIEAINYCVDCEFNYCSGCLKPHGKIPSSSKHELLPIGMKRAKPKLPICLDHNIELTAFCENCGSLVCDQCIQTVHKYHTIKLVNEHLDVLKRKLDDVINAAENVKERLFRDCSLGDKILNYHALVASSWKEQVINNAEIVKKAVDDYVLQLTDAIDDESTRFKEFVENDMAGIKAKYSNVQDDILALKQDKRDQNYKNVEIPYQVMHEEKFTSHIYKEFKVSFCPDDDLVDKINFNKLKDSLHNDCKCKINVQDEIWNGEYLSFTTNDEAMFLSTPDGFVDAFSKSNFIGSYDQLMLDPIRDILAIEDRLFVFGDSPGNKKCHILLKMTSECDFLGFEQIYSCYNLKARHCIMSKSYTNDLLLAFEYKLIHLSNDGDVVKEVSLPFSIECALQLDGVHYCCYSKFEGIVLVDDCGDVIRKCSSLPRTTFARSLTRDEFGHICLCDLNGRLVVVDAFLNFITFFRFKDRVRKIQYCKNRDRILLLTKGGLMEVDVCTNDD